MFIALRLLTPLMETPGPPIDTPASKQVDLTPCEISRILRVHIFISILIEVNITIISTCIFSLAWFGMVWPGPNIENKFESTGGLLFGGGVVNVHWYYITQMLHVVM